VEREQIRARGSSRWSASVSAPFLQLVAEDRTAQARPDAESARATLMDAGAHARARDAVCLPHGPHLSRSWPARSLRPFHGEQPRR